MEKAAGNVYQDLSAECEDNVPTEIESMCPNCEDNGITKLLLTRVPFAKEVILMSFECENCGHKNNEIQSGSKVQEKGIEIRVTIKSPQDLNRQVVKTEYCGITIPEVGLEIPHGSQAGEITTVEGIITRAMEGLGSEQTERLKMNPEDGGKVADYLLKLSSLLTLQTPFTVIINDPSGNSVVENPDPTVLDSNIRIIHFPRTWEHEKQLGFVGDEEEENSADEKKNFAEGEETEDLSKEIFTFQVDCPACGVASETNSKVVDIPHFKDMIIMSSVCDSCGYKTSDVQSANGIAEKGMKLTLSVEKPEDLRRDLVKSDMCYLRIPEFEMEAGMATLSGRFSTVEGILEGMKEQLREHGEFVLGDSGTDEAAEKIKKLLERFDAAVELKERITLVLDDPTGNSYIESLAGNAADPRLKLDYYERSYEQNEDLGINDMRLDHYSDEKKNSDDSEDISQNEQREPTSSS